MRYFLSPALAQLRVEVNALWPHRDKASDGWIGDLAHQTRASDHNPAADDGSINAFDFDRDGIDVDRVRRAVMGDRRANYVIWSGLIYRRKNGWRPERYSGTNGHYHHVHVSILHGDTFEDDRSGWGLATATAVSNPAGWTGVVIPATQTGTAPAPLTPLAQEDDMLTLILWCYAELVGRPNPPSVAEIENWVTGTPGWTSAQVLSAFLSATAEPGSIDKAYRDILGRNVDPAGAASNTGKSIRQVRTGLAAAYAAGAR